MLVPESQTPRYGFFRSQREYQMSARGALVLKEQTFCPRCGHRITDPSAHMRASGRCGNDRPSATRDRAQDRAQRAPLWADSQRW